MMPTFRLETIAPAGNHVTYWTQDPDGMAERLRSCGWFVSYNVLREEPPTRDEDAA